MRQAMKLWILGVLVACPVAAGPVYLEPEVFYTLHMLQLRDPWWRPLSPFGQSAGVGYGTVPPTFATVGENPGSGELFVDMNAGVGGVPQLQIFDGTSWGAVGTVVGGAVLANSNVFTGVNTFNRTAAGVDANFGGAEGDANSISIDGDLGCIKFEGASADAAETHLCGDGAPDGGLFLRNGAAASPSFLNIFNTYTDASNNEGLLITWAGPNIAEILTTAAGTGVRRDLRLLANGSYLNLTSAGAAGASGTFAEFNTVLNIMNGTDTQNVVAINPTNANHTGASNIFNALSVGAIVQDADASERGVSVTGGSESWDASLSFVKGSATDFGRIHWFDGATSRALIMVDASDLHVRAQSADLELYGEDGIHFESNSAADNFIFNPEPNAAGDGSTFATIQATLGIMDGTDTVNALAIDLTNANHTGATNVLNAIKISTIVADVDATETAISVGLGGAGATQWDVGLDVTGIVEAGSANKIAVKLPNLGIMGNTAISTWYIGTGTGGCTNFTNLGSGIGFGPSVCNSSAAGSSTTGLFQTGAITLPVMNGSDTWTGFAFNSTNANHTGASNTLNAFAAAAITGDADATETAVSVGTGWDNALDSQLWDLLNVVPAAGTSGNLGALTATITAQDGTDTTNGLTINLTNADHTGSTNQVNAISIGAITGDAQSDETALRLGSGFDTAIRFDGGTMSIRSGSSTGNIDIGSGTVGTQAILSLETGPIAQSGAFYYATTNPTVPIMGAGNSLDIFQAAVVNANHTGGTLSAFGALAITGDADATEVGVSIGSGWDQGITVPAGSAALPAIAFTADPNTGFLNPSADAIGMSLAGVQNWLFATPPAAGSGGTLETLTATLTAQDGSDTTNALAINLTNANHTGTEFNNIVAGISFGDITGDAQSLETAIVFGSGYDIFASRISGDVGFSLASAAGIYTRNAGLASSAVEARMNAGGNTGTSYSLFQAVNVRAMNGSDTEKMFDVAITNQNHTSTGNELIGYSATAMTGDADANEVGMVVGTGWDYFARHDGIAFAGLGTPTDGTMAYCTDCKVTTAFADHTCTNAGSGSYAFRQAGAWKCLP